MLHTFRAGGSRSETEFIGFVGRRARTDPESGLLFRLFQFQGSRSETEFIGFADRRARTDPESGLLFRLFQFQGSRSKTEFIGFAGRRARTDPESGLLFRLFPFQGSRSKTEFIGFAGWQARTEKAARRGNGAPVGVARRRRKGLREARRQHGSPRAGETVPLLAWPDEGARACGEQGANREACVLG